MCARRSKANGERVARLFLLPPQQLAAWLASRVVRFFLKLKLNASASDKPKGR